MYEETYTGEEEQGGGFMMGVLCGAAIGAALGLLLAPKTGAEFRGQLAGSADWFRRRAGETYEQASEAAEGMMDKGRQAYEKAAGAAQRGREKFDEARTNVSGDAGAPTTTY